MSAAELTKHSYHQHEENCSAELTTTSDLPVRRSEYSWPAGLSRSPQIGNRWTLTAASLCPAAAAGPAKHRSISLNRCGLTTITDFCVDYILAYPQIVFSGTKIIKIQNTA